MLAQNYTISRNVPLNDIVKRSTVAEKPVLKYEALREADILWEKRIWRVIDTREKMNLAFRYPEMPLFSILYNGIVNEKITAYSAEYDDFSIPLAVEDVESQLYTTDTIPVFNPVDYTETLQIIRNEPDIDNIKRYRIQELWYFNSKTSTLKVRILGIAPLIEELDDMGNVRWEKPLFWVNYQQCRDVLARYPTFNTGNDKGTMTWEDLFEMRQFTSYVYKQSNIHDQRLQDYISGTDLLLEADKIKQEIFNFEHDLWSY